MNYIHTVGGKTLGFPECAEFVTDMSLGVPWKLLLLQEIRALGAFGFEATAQCRPRLLVLAYAAQSSAKTPT